ncbi:MAG: InlB B-repeat-containing protein, partial [Promethearchaeota archaeon]
QPITILSNWDKNYKLKTSVGTGGSVTPSGTSWHTEGEIITLTAKPDSEYIFLRWEASGGGSYSGTNPKQFSNMNQIQPSQLSANMEQKQGEEPTKKEQV